MKIILVVILTTVIAAAGITISLMISQRQSNRDRALSIIAGKTGAAGKKKSDELQDKDKRRAAIARKLKEAESGEKEDPNKEKGKSTLTELIQCAGFEFSVTRFMTLSGFSAIGFMGGASAFGMPPAVIILLGLVGFLGFPRLVLAIITNRRQKKFLAGFADALEAMMRLLKAGMPMNEAIKMCSKEFDGPIGEEMSRIYELQKIGTPLGEAALIVAKRMPIPEMRMFATGLTIQQQTGSSMTDILNNLSKVIRARFQLKRKVKALSAEAKSSAGIIGAMPPLVALGLNQFNPGYIDIIFQTKSGMIGLSCFIGWMCLGALIMWKMTNFKV